MFGTLTSIARFAEEARILTRDTDIPTALVHAGLAFRLRWKALDHFPTREWVGIVCAQSLRLKMRHRRSHQIPRNQWERDGIAEFQDCPPD